MYVFMHTQLVDTKWKMNLNLLFTSPYPVSCIQLASRNFKYLASLPIFMAFLHNV